MKAAVLEDIGKIVYKEIETPICKEDSILLKVEASALCGTDIKAIFQGSRLIKKLPQIIGHEIAGTVIEVGKNVEEIKEGDRLVIVPSNPCGECRICKRNLPPDLCPNHEPIGFVYPGGFAQYMLIPPCAVKVKAYVRIPDNVDFNEASITEALGCVIHGQNMLNINKEDTVVVIGAGPIGCMHLEMARIRDAKKRILLQRSEKRLKLAEKLGFADVYCNTSNEDPVKIVMKETNDMGADVVISATSSGDAHELAVEIAGIRGRINLFGGLPKDSSYVKFDSNKIHYKELTILGSAGTGPKEVKEALDLISQKKLNAKRFITHVLPLKDILRGIELMKGGQALKVVLKP